MANGTISRWNITVGEYIPYLTSRDKDATLNDAPKLISQGNWLHSVTWDSSNNYLYFLSLRLYTFLLAY